ncbi:hypothetical protein V2J09_002457 [Rumex salicifolius]
MDDYTREMMELKTLVTRTLEKKGVLAKIRAELRASVFEAIEEEDRVVEKEEGLPPALLGSCNDRAKRLHASPSGRLLTALVCEYMDWAQLNHTHKVYLPECNLPKDSWKAELKEFSCKNGLDLSRNGESGPLLLDVLEGFLKFESLSQAGGSGRRGVTPENESVPNLDPQNTRRPSSSSVAGGLPPLGRAFPASQTSDRRAGSSMSSYRKEDCNWRYDNEEELSDELSHASSELQNLQLDRKARNLTSSWRHARDGTSEDESGLDNIRLTLRASNSLPSDSTVHLAPFLAAALVTLAPDGSFLSTLLMTPTATVCLMSLTAKRPRGGYSEKVSTTMGLVGIILTIPASPFFKNLGSFSSSLPERLELHSNVGSVTVEHRGVSVSNLSRVVHDDDLRSEAGSTLGRVVLGVRGDVTTLEILDSNILHVESHIVTGKSFLESLVVHLNRLDFSGQPRGSKCDNGSRLEDTSLHSSNRHRSNTTNLVDILERETKGLSGTLVPVEVGGPLNHVVTLKTRDGDKGDFVWVVTNLLHKHKDHIYLVTAANHLPHTKSESKKSMLTGLAILRDTGFKTSSGGINDEDSAISLGCSSNHVLDEVTMSRGIDDSAVVPSGLKLPESNINGDTTLTLSLQFVKHPRILE